MPNEAVRNNSYIRRDAAGNLTRVTLGGKPLQIIKEEKVGGMGPEWRLNAGNRYQNTIWNWLVGHNVQTRQFALFAPNSSGVYPSMIVRGHIIPEWKLKVAVFMNPRDDMVGLLFGHLQGTPAQQALQLSPIKFAGDTGFVFENPPLADRVGLEWDLRLAQLTRDGRFDILGISNGRLHAWITDETKVLREAEFGAVGSEWPGSKMHVADMDDDGLADLFAQDVNGKIIVMRNINGERFDGGTAWGSIPPTTTLYIADLNNDGILDVLGQEPDGTIRAYLANGKGFVGDGVRLEVAAGSTLLGDRHAIV